MAVDFKNILAWQKAMDLTDMVYKITKHLPSDERFGLIDQMRRAAISIPSNIAEGFGRKSRNEFIRFSYIAHGSLKELETQLLICRRLYYLSEEEFAKSNALVLEVGKLIGGLISKLSNHQ